MAVKSLIKSFAPDSVHEALKPISWIVGKWQCSEAVGGKSFYPTMSSTVPYHECIEFYHYGKPFLQYCFTSQNAGGEVMHVETGFIRVNPATKHVAFISAHNNGVVLVEEGQYVDGVQQIKAISNTSNGIGRMTFGKEPHVTQTGKEFTLSANTLEYKMFMGTTKTKLTEHLACKYTRVDD